MAELTNSSPPILSLEDDIQDAVDDIWNGIERRTKEEWLQREYIKLMKRECRVKSESKFMTPPQRNNPRRGGVIQNAAPVKDRKSQQYGAASNGERSLKKPDDNNRDVERQVVSEHTSMPDV